MGSPKALLRSPDGRLFVTRIVDTLRESGIANVVVVTGRDHHAIVDALQHARRSPLIVRNPDPARGQLSSMLVGMDAVVNANTDGVLMTLVDVPMVRVSTVVQVISEWRRTRAPIVRPAIGHRHGHPVIFDRSVFDALRAAPLEGGAKSVVRAHEHDLLNVPVSDEGCLVDVDTPEQYRRMNEARGTKN